MIDAVLQNGDVEARELGELRGKRIKLKAIANDEDALRR